MFGLTTDGNILFLTRFIRLFSYGFLSIGLILYLTELGYSQYQIGSLFTATLLGDLVITFYLTVTADSYGRRSILLTGALLKLGAGLVFAFIGNNFYALLVAGIIGIISPTGGEIGPFLAIEQAALTEAIKDKHEITRIFGLYNLSGYIAQASGALAAGSMINILMNSYNYPALIAYRAVLIGYALFGLCKFFLYLLLSSSIEPLHPRTVNSGYWASKFGLHRPSSVRVVVKLSLLFIIDSFAGGFVMQTIIVYWFAVVWEMNEQTLGVLLMACNILAGISALVATPLVSKIGAINTMVVTHFPSNIFLLLVPLMPTKESAVGVLLIRFCISQMDVPARQTYVISVVEEDERSAAGGITNIVRSIGLSISPIFVGYLLADPSNRTLFGLPFIVSGVLKCLYDILLYISFRMAKSEAEHHHQEDEHGAHPVISNNKIQDNFGGTKYAAVPTSEKQ